jgi:hypothetical protein
MQKLNLKHFFNHFKTFQNKMFKDYVYLLQTYECVTKNQNVYKIGKTKQENLKRFKSLSFLRTVLLIQIECLNCSIMERTLINLFKEKFIFRRDLGYEYFEGDSTLDA